MEQSHLKKFREYSEEVRNLALNVEFETAFFRLSCYKVVSPDH